MLPVVFMVEECDVRWLYSSVCGYCEVQIVSAFFELEILLMWDKSVKWIVAVHGVGGGY